MRSVLFLIISLTIGGISLSAYGESIEDMFENAERLIIDDKYSLAIEKYSDILDIEKEDEISLLNRAYAFSKIGDYEASLRDFSTVLKNNPENMLAVEGAATITAMYECKSYYNCPPLEGLQLFEDALKREPTNEDIKMKRDYFLTRISPVDIHDTDKDYFVNIIHITRDKDAKLVAWLIGNLFIWDNRAPTTQMLGRYQPWHDGHQALLDRAIAKHGQVFLMVRDMPTDENNPYTAEQVIDNLQDKLVKYAGKVNLAVVPNILNITYGRDVGYKIEQEKFDKQIEEISATKIRSKST